MPNKRIFLFFCAMACILLWTLLSPAFEKSQRLEGTPNVAMGTSMRGYKGLFKLLQTTSNQSISLWEHSMMRLPENAAPKTVWFIDPTIDLFFDGKAYREHMKNLVEQGNNFVFVFPRGGMVAPVLSYLNKWYNLSVQPGSEFYTADETIPVKSEFASRQISNIKLSLQPEQTIFDAYRRLPAKKQGERSSLLTFKSSNASSQTLLAASQPLILKYQWGKGSITLIANSELFRNSQLDKADNAALAVAVQEMFPNQPVTFEVYSQGFRNNPDMITYLATGPGISFLITLVLLFVLLGVWLIQQPIKKRLYSIKSDERYYTQEAFIEALATHYDATNQWQALYCKLLTYFHFLCEQRYPELSPHQQIERIAQIPMLPVSLEELKTLFDDKRVVTQSQFMHNSTLLLQLQHKVFGHEQQSPLLRNELAFRR